ncbi:cytochrome P450 [Mariannaea sp. PMI_226]|nr:cytochrome P450 [Mariannaea sp. PMI_226]
MDGRQVVPTDLASLIRDLQEPTSLGIICTVLVVLLTTRFLTGGSSTFKDGSKSPPLAPYWIPLLGHLPRLYFSPSWALTRLRNRYSEGLFSIRVFGNTHTFIFKPDLVATLLQQPGSVADKQPFARHLLVSNFGLSGADVEAYDKAAADLQRVTEEYLSGSHLANLSKATFKDLKYAAPDLVSFNSYPIDHADWERLANAVKVAEDAQDSKAAKTSTMAVDFVELIKNFVARTANVAIFGADFIENFAELWPHFWQFDNSFLTLALNVPIWVPWLGGQRGRMALRSVLGFMREYHDAWEKQLNQENKEPRWQDFHTVSPLIKARLEVFRKHGLSVNARASCDLALLWSLNASSTSLISWSLIELYRDPLLLEIVRKEIAPFAKVIQPKHEFSVAVWVPPKIESVDVDGLATKCPHLMAAYIETMRRYGGGWSASLLREDMTLKSDKSSYSLKKGTFAHVLNDLHHSDPKSFPKPKDWNIERHLEADQTGKTQIASMGSVRPNDGSMTLSDDSEITMRNVLLFTSVIISLYDVQPPDGGEWSLPWISKGPVSSSLVRPLRVWISRRVTSENVREYLENIMGEK